jgi:cell wall-associated NlpC family hydrolase
MKAFRSGLAVALVLLGCATRSTRTRHATLPPPALQSRAGAPEKSAGPAPGSSTHELPEVARAVEAASALVGQRAIVIDGVDYGPGCAALVRAAFARAGRPLPPEVLDARSVLALADRRGAMSTTRRPRPGDLVFLSDRPGGPAAHVALVARAEPDGTALVLHRVARGVRRVRLNLAYPERPTDPATGKHINDMLIVQARPLPAGSLVVGVSDLLRRG